MGRKEKIQNKYFKNSKIKKRKLKIGIFELYFVLQMKSHLQSYPCPLQINSFWNMGFLLGITIILQIITGIFLALHYTSDLNSALGIWPGEGFYLPDPCELTFANT